MLMVERKLLNQKEKLARLWVHENQRVFADRLTNEDDHHWLSQLMQAQVRILYVVYCILYFLSHRIYPPFYCIYTPYTPHATLQVEQQFDMVWAEVVPRPRLVYGDFINGADSARVYDEIGSMDALKTVHIL
jgi:hypothetical protein